jgi:glutamyl-tRNA synthetase
VSQVVALQQERAKTLCEFPLNSAYFFVEDVEYPLELMIKGGISKERARDLLGACASRLETVDTFDVAGLEAPLRALAEEMSVKPGDMFGLLRVAVTGRIASPPLFETMAVVGKNRCLKRIQSAVDRLSAPAAA